MSFRYLDMEHYERIEHFRYFLSMPYPYAGVTVDIDVTDIVSFCKARGYSFYLTFLHAAAKAADRVPELRRRIHDGVIIEYDTCPTSHTELCADGTYCYCTLRHDKPFAEYIAYAVIKTESDFQSNYVSADGNVGLMQLSETTFRQLATMMKENTDSGILYDPETNVRYGIYYLSYLYTEYNRWNTVFAVFFAGRETVDAWMADPSLTDTLGNLTKIPDDATADFVKRVTENVELYKELYYIDNHA